MKNVFYKRFIQFLESDKFPIIIAIIILIGYGLDTGITYNKFLRSEYGFSYEANPLVRRYIATDFWYIPNLFVTSFYSFLIVVSYKIRSVNMRIFFFICSITAFCWILFLV